ncbi:MAG: winged helix DNA-binding protein [Proteobacteria bacterium]|nr:winged helix DNA-binding protein [Pseudomonadota bacterium]
MSIKDVANLACVTHSAASQTIAQMTREDLVQIEMGRDRRERLVGLTPRALAMMPDLERCWAATARAAASLDEDLSFELEPVLRAAVAALTAKPFLDRMVGPQDAYKKD